MQIAEKITPCLWFDGNAREAVEFYVSLFANSKITGITHYPEAGEVLHGRVAGSVMTVAFELNGRPFIALNGGPEFKFNWAVSFQIDCENQDEVDHYWAKLAEGGHEGQCGWVRDRFGLPWQVIPRRLTELLADPDRAKAGRAMLAMMKMVKIDIAGVEAAAAGLA